MLDQHEVALKQQNGGAEISKRELFRSKFQTMKENLREPVVMKYYALLILQGLMPSFEDYAYYFAIDEMQISKFTISFSTVVLGLICFTAPIFYQKYLKETEYVELFFAAQFVYLFQSTFMLFMALRWNLMVGVPDIVMFYVFATIPEAFERLL